MSDEEIPGQKLLIQKNFYELLNEHVFLPHLGRELSFKEAKEIVHGIADVIFRVAHEGMHVRFGRLGTFRIHVRPPGRAWNPVTMSHFDAPARKKLVFKQSKSTKLLLTEKE